VTPFAIGYQCFGGPCCLHLQGEISQKNVIKENVAISFALGDKYTQLNTDSLIQIHRTCIEVDSLQHTVPSMDKYLRRRKKVILSKISKLSTLMFYHISYQLRKNFSLSK
jgi:hypothetical protein